MIKSRLDKLGLEVSRLGFGCMRLPTTADGKIDRVKSQEMIDLAIASGVNYFDTAFGYHNEESQYFTGEALKKYPRDSFYLATKLPIWDCKTPDDVDRIFNEQLKRCQVERFDFYLIHALDADRRQTLINTKAYEYLSKKKQDGVIGAFGFSYHGDIETFRKLLDEYEWDFVQIQMNYIDYALNDGTEYCSLLEEKGIPCVVMEPVRGGFLANPPEAAVKEMTDFDDGKITPSGWALRWCMNQPNMKVILSGMSTIEQVKENIETFSEERGLDAGESALIDRVRDITLSIKTIPCTGCAYCMDCSFGVDIPGVFEVYNHYKLFQNAFRSGLNYKALVTEKHGGNACMSCGACAPMCPQGIDIPARLAEAHEVLAAL